MISIKGCFSNIIIVLALTFIGLFIYNEYSENGLSILEKIGIDSERIESFEESLEVGNSTFEDFLIEAGIKEIEPVYIEPITYKPLLNEENTHFPEEPRTIEDFKKVFLYMANKNMLEIELHYSDSYEVNFQQSDEIQTSCSTAFDTIVVEYVDLFSGVSRADYKMVGNSLSSSLTLKLGSQYVSDEELVRQQRYFEEAASSINQSLLDEKQITPDMSDKEIAEVLFTYVTQNLAYDTSVHPESYTGYGAVKNNNAVCQGYTALYNYLLKLNDIACYGQSGYIISDNSPHIWTVATLDDSSSYIDVTFGDPTPDRKNYSDYSYYNTTKEFLSKTRTGVN